MFDKLFKKTKKKKIKRNQSVVCKDNVNILVCNFLILSKALFYRYSTSFKKTHFNFQFRKYLYFLILPCTLINIFYLRPMSYMWLGILL